MSSTEKAPETSTDCYKQTATACMSLLVLARTSLLALARMSLLALAWCENIFENPLANRFLQYGVRLRCRLPVCHTTVSSRLKLMFCVAQKSLVSGRQLK